MKQEFNIIINGVGGQGLVTLIRIISQAALGAGYEVKASELHGLSQRGGSVEVHLRFGKKVWSPLVSLGAADLIISLEMQEALRGLFYASDKTVYLVNKCKTPTLLQDVSEAEILKSLRKVTQQVCLVSASDICKDILDKEVLSGTYLLGLACMKKVLPLKEDLIIAAIKKVVPKQHLAINLRAFALARES